MQPQQEQELVERFYSQAMAWATSDEQELAVAQELLERARRGFVVNDTGNDLVYVQDPDLPPDADYLIDERPLQQERLRSAAFIVGGLIIAVLAVLFVYRPDPRAGSEVATQATDSVPIFLATRTLTPSPTTTATPTPSATPTPTATSTPRPTPTTTPTPLPPEEIELKPEPVKLEADAVIPISLEIAGRYFPVVPTALRDGTWAYVTEPDQVSWLAGSYANVVLGLPYSADGLTLLAATLSLSDTLTVRNNVGAAHIYQVIERRRVDVYAVEILGQRRAGLTLALLAGSQEDPNRRLVIQAIPAREATKSGDRKEVQTNQGQ